MKQRLVDVMTYQDMVGRFYGESDRGAAVLAGSVADEFLAKYLKSKIVGGADFELLFSRFGPVSTFSQRIEIGFAFGLISETTRADLNFVRKIRNEFVTILSKLHLPTSQLRTGVEALVPTQSSQWLERSAMSNATTVLATLLRSGSRSVVGTTRCSGHRQPNSPMHLTAASRRR